MVGRELLCRTVVFEDGCTDRFGKPIEHWGRESQARRFESEHDANQVVLARLASDPTPPVTYEVIRLPRGVEFVGFAATWDRCGDD